jgi:hypothetical protein
MRNPTYHQKLSPEVITRSYHQEPNLSPNTRSYHQKLSPEPEVITKNSPEVIQKLFRSYPELITRSSPEVHQKFTRSYPKFHQKFTRTRSYHQKLSPRTQLITKNPTYHQNATYHQYQNHKRPGLDVGAVTYPSKFLPSLLENPHESRKS